MKFIFDTKLKQFSIGRDILQERYGSNSEEFIHNCIRLMIRPEHQSSNHWRDEIYAFLLSTLGRSCNCRHPIEFLFCSIGEYPNRPKYFYISKKLINNYLGDIESEPYGSFRSLSSNQIGIGLWIFYKMINPKMDSYSKDELKRLIQEWYECINLDNKLWIDASKLSYKDVRVFSEFKRYPFIINY